ncbi:isopenicillin N synthase family dioxygenase [Hydrogenophaga laconesensis]|uniref:2-oxoglutarate-dependent ethylene/succinate-forming enzyme n=1 Tax=Hydrogenophaga laconesensis TaxID=1805971 RepID=A0ABU1VD65_9BURK|nr:isopenicillin N synthase family oxygenase [Hydrogenophaga laconesensis]MDR7095410.1 isopenicillin N synthase-like dioxygenase [Hydrogenophaga laconesensis]
MNTASTTTETHPASIPMSSGRLPEVDLHPFLFGDAAARQRVARAMAEACETYGFFYLVHHGMASEVIAAGFDAAQRFFDLPLEQRLACRSTQPRQNRGYQPMFDTALAGGKADVKESFDMGYPLQPDDADLLAGMPFHSLNTWPDAGMIGFRPQVEALYFAMLACGHQVLRAMALALGADPNFFVGHCVKPTTNMRLVHYPPQCISPEEGIGARPHTDKGLITLLLNDDNGGLQVMADEERWIDAPPRADAIIVNVGDLMTRWTNGRFRSALHRVINTTGRQRFSIPQFHHPNFHAVVDPAHLAHDGAVNFEPVVAGEFVASGFRRDRKSWAATAPA